MRAGGSTTIDQEHQLVLLIRDSQPLHSRIPSVQTLDYHGLIVIFINEHQVATSITLLEHLDSCRQSRSVPHLSPVTCQIDIAEFGFGNGIPDVPRRRTGGRDYRQTREQQSCLHLLRANITLHRRRTARVPEARKVRKQLP